MFVFGLCYTEYMLVFVLNETDAHHIPIYPQPPYNIPENSPLAAADRLLCVSNPSTLRINEVTIGISSLDIIAHLASKECSK